jgi:hypothetical protein
VMHNSSHSIWYGCTPDAASIKITNVEKPIVWKQITTEFRGRAVSGSYAVEDGAVKVRTPDGEKTAPLVGAGASFRITLLAPKNLVLREDHLLAGSALHREGFQDQRLNRQKLLVRFQLASLRRHRPPKQMQLASPD